MTSIPIYSPFQDNECKYRIDLHGKKQQRIRENIRSCTITSVQVTNWAEGTMQNTVHRQLMTVEIIYEKEVISSVYKKMGKTVLCYHTNHKTKTVTFYFSRARSDEARGVARGLPLFIRNFYKLDPCFFFSSKTVLEALKGSWSDKNRTLLTKDEAVDMVKLDDLDNLKAIKQ